MSNTTAHTIVTATVNGRNLLDAIRAFGGSIASQAVSTGYPGKLAIVQDVVKQGNLLAKRGDTGVSVGLAHAISAVLPGLAPATVAFGPGDVIELTVVSPADLAADEFIPDVALTAAEAEAQRVAKANADRAEVIAKVEAARALAGSLTAGGTAVAESSTDRAARLEAERLAKRAADGILEAHLDRPWVVTPAKWDAPRSTTIRFTVPKLDDVVAFYTK